MTNQEIWQAALRQSAIDAGCQPEDFTAAQNRVVVSRPNANARRYLKLPFFCNLVTYGDNVVAAVDERVAEFVQKYIDRFGAAHGFETPALHLLTEEFERYGVKPCFMAEYWLPDLDLLEARPSAFELRVLAQPDFANLYTTEWGNALCADRKHLDVLGVGAYDGDTLVGLAGCSADCDTMWQIGVDVLPAYRRQGIAAALTSRLALEILQRGRVPFYCCAWANVRSARNAIKSGFRPAWMEFTCVPTERIAEMKADRL